MQVDIEKPLGLQLGAAKGPNGGLVVKVSNGCSCRLLKVFQRYVLQMSQRVGFQCALCMQNASGNAAKAGLKNGDTVIYTSSFFGDELWPSDNLGFTRSAIANAPSPVTVTFVSTAFASLLHISATD